LRIISLLILVSSFAFNGLAESYHDNGKPAVGIEPDLRAGCKPKNRSSGREPGISPVTFANYPFFATTGKYMPNEEFACVNKTERP
jgi:hypothetical protein